MQQRNRFSFRLAARLCAAATGIALLGIVTITNLRADEPARCTKPQASNRGTTAEEKSAQRGYRLLTTKAYLPSDFDQEVFDQLWQAWDEPLRSQAENATPEDRRRMAFSRYGLTEAPQLDRLPTPSGRTAMQYV